MNPNGQRLEPPDISRFDENLCKIPPEQLLPYAGRHVAWNPVDMRIVASGESIEELDQALAVQGIHFSQVVYDYIDAL